MSTALLRPEVTVVLDAAALQAASGTITLDSGSVPYVQATVELPFQDDATMEWLDPREVVRVVIEAGDATGTPRTFDLGLRNRTVDHNGKTVSLTLASDEALLTDYATLEHDGAARALEPSLRDIVDYVLDRIGAVLEAGADDEDVTAYWTITNLITNPTIEADVSNWAQGTGASGMDRIFMTTPAAHSGAYALGWAAAAGDANVLPADTAITTTTYPVTPGDSYVWAFYIASSAPTDARAAIQWWSADGTVLSATSFGDTIISDDTGWERATLIATVPNGASHGMPYVNTMGNAGGELHYIDDALFYKGDELVDEFTGDTSDDANYTYEWGSDAHASTSSRVAIVERPPELFVWKPGVTAWEFLMPLTSAAGMVLWCDELRQWHLAYPESRTLATLLPVIPSSTSSGSDTLSRDESEGFVTGVVMHYTWTEGERAREEWDTAGTEEKVLVVEMTTPFPGHGAAAAILARRQGTGRKQDVETITRWDATPGMSVQVSLPGAPDTTGRLTSVEFDLPTGFMRLGTSGLIDIVPGSIAALTGTIDALVGTIDSL